MEDPNIYYEISKGYLKKMGIHLKDWGEKKELVANADIELKSVKAFVSKELDAGTLSKAALKDSIIGDPRVIEADKKLAKAKSDAEIAWEQYAFVDKYYTLEKKAMDASIEELKKFRV